jgi:competence protein ComEC
MSETHKYRFPFAKYPAVRLTIFFSGGLALGSVMPFSVTFMMLMTFVGLQILMEILNQYVYKPFFLRLVNYAYLFMIVLFSCYYWQHTRNDDSLYKTILSGLDGKNATIYGLITRSSVNTGGNLTLILKSDSLSIRDQTYYFPTIIQLRMFRADSMYVSRLKLNHYASIRVLIRPPPPKRNPNAFDVQRWLQSLGVEGSGLVEEVYSSNFVDNRLSWVWWRSVMDNKIDDIIDTDVRPLIKAILLGNKNELDSDTRTSFSRAGLSHLMAVSGMHVGFVLMPIWLIIPWFWTSKFGRPAGLFFIASILLFYAGLTGFSASVSRASITASLLAIGKLFQRNRDSLNTTGVAAMIILLYDPRSLMDIGFQLSFCAVTVILVLGPVLRDTISSDIRYNWQGSIIQFLGISTIVQLGLFPILAASFGEFSIAGPLANTIAVPITQLLFIWSLLALPISFASDYFAGWVMVPVEWLARLLAFIAHLVGNYEYSWIPINQLSSILTVFWFAAIGLLATIYIPRLRWKWLILLLTVSNIMMIEKVVVNRQLRTLTVTVFDVGQGDAILIQSPSGKSILYDTGVLSPFQNSGSSVLLPELRARNINSLDAIILSHPHADHIGGVLSLIHGIDIKVIYQSPFLYKSAVFLGYMDAASKKGIPILEVQSGMVIEIDSELLMMVLHPSGNNLGSDPNAHSVVLKVVYGDTSFLLTGDAELRAESVVAETHGPFLKSNWYKAGHHGSKTSSNHQFMELVSPDFIAVSLGYRNRYQHPHLEASLRMFEKSSNLSYTSLDGALVYESDGYSIRQINWRN